VSAPCLGVGAWGGVMKLTAGVRFLGSGVGSGRACGVEFCFVSCSGLFYSVFFPSSFLSSYFVRHRSPFPFFLVLCFRGGVSRMWGKGGLVDLPTVRSFVHTHIGASLLLHLLRGLLLPFSSLPV